MGAELGDLQRYKFTSYELRVTSYKELRDLQLSFTALIHSSHSQLPQLRDLQAGYAGHAAHEQVATALRHFGANRIESKTRDEL